MLHEPPLERARTRVLFLHDAEFPARPFVEALVASGFAVQEEVGALASANAASSGLKLLIAQGRSANGLLRNTELVEQAEAMILISSDVEPSTCDVLQDWRRPLLVLHNLTDERVSIDRAEAVFRAASQPKSFIALERGDHAFSDKADACRAAALLADWAAPRWPTEARAPHEKDQHGDVTVSWLGQGLAHVVHAPPHHVLADEPPDLGGEERGPNPYDLLLGALGACTAMTVRMYANLKKWPLEGMSVRLRHARLYAKDCEDCETKEGMVDRIEREIRFDGPLSEEQLARLMEIANKCPVHKTLTTETRIPTRRLT